MLQTDDSKTDVGVEKSNGSNDKTTGAKDMIFELAPMTAPALIKGWTDTPSLGAIRPTGAIVAHTVAGDPRFSIRPCSSVGGIGRWGFMEEIE